MNEQNASNKLLLPVLPLRGLVVMPKSSIHFDVSRKKSVAAIEYSIKNNKPLFCTAQKDPLVEEPSREMLYEMGTIIQIKQLLKLPGGGLRILVEGLSRARLGELYPAGRILRGEIEAVLDSEVPLTGAEEIALAREIRALFEEYAAVSAKLAPDVLFAVSSIDGLSKLVDVVASNLTLSLEDKQQLVQTVEPHERAATLIALLDRELEILAIEQEINEKVKEQMDKNQREYFMREQIKIIKNELGEDGTDAEADRFTDKIIKLKLPKETSDKLLDEARNLSKMQFGSAEGSVIRSYLEVCLALPWNTITKDKLDIDKARKLLDREHYGLEKVKERVLEYLAVKKLSPNLGSQVLFLVGPPGVGKTSVASSIARAMGRKFVRISLGGVRDEADIRGHRKTYIGSMPGRIMSAVKTAGTKNPVILLDEVDKISSDFRGDPAAALLEVFDTEQNHAFIDHYIEVPFDLSNVMFIATANSTETVSRPLLDRMEKIEIASYTDNEKLEIAKKHLIPKQLKRHGLRPAELKMSDAVLKEIIDLYTKESGVRGLERQITTLCRKAALFKVEKGLDKLSVTKDNLVSLLGAPRYKHETEQNQPETGVANGLAWTSVGGECLKIEVSSIAGTGKLELTGSLGDIMKESAKAALTYIRSRADKFKIDPDFYKNCDLHIHVPEGAVPKDGPSAGITMVTALLSELTGVPVRGDVAMTGEITLRGRVLPIGGLREKSMAALRNNFKTVIIPEDNMADLEEIDQSVRQKLNFLPVSSIDEIIGTAFTGNVLK